jgi:FkbM family methyltransferase
MLRSIKFVIVGFVLVDALVVLHVWAGIPMADYATFFGSPQMCTFKDWFHGYRTFLRISNDRSRMEKEAHLIKRDSQGYQFWETPVWSFWVPKGTREFFVDVTAAQYRQNAYDGSAIKPGAVVLDLGGFVGDYAKFALEAGASKVITVEPSPEALECIRRNLSAEIAQGKVIVYAKGVWDKDDRLFLESERDDNPAGNSIVEGTPANKPGVWVPLTTIDKIVEELNLSRVDVIKMDIEGAEVRAIRGASKTLERFRPEVAVATEHTDDIVQNSKNVIQTFREVAGFYDYKCGYCYMDARKRLVTETLFFLPRK